MTCSDSGGTMEIVEDGLNGLIVDPDPRALAEAIDRLEVPRGRPDGDRAHDTLQRKGIGWDRVVDGFGSRRKIAILNNQVPFVREEPSSSPIGSRTKLELYGHQAEIIKVPFNWTPCERVIDHMLAARLTRLPNVDRVIALKFPAYYVPHENKVLWLLHQFRQAYDLWALPTRTSRTGRRPRGERGRRGERPPPSCRRREDLHQLADRGYLVSRCSARSGPRCSIRRFFRPRLLCL